MLNQYKKVKILVKSLLNHLAVLYYIGKMSCEKNAILLLRVKNLYGKFFIY